MERGTVKCLRAPFRACQTILIIYLWNQCVRSISCTKSSPVSSLKITNTTKSYAMDEVLDEVVPTEDLKKYEKVYHEQLNTGNITQKAQFEYAWCLVRSKYSADIRKGLILLEELFHTDKEESKRDYLYYLAIGNARIKEYNKALQYVRGFLQIEPGNHQVHDLEVVIKRRMEKEGLVGVALTGGIVLGIAGLVGLGIALSKKSH